MLPIILNYTFQNSQTDVFVAEFVCSMRNNLQELFNMDN